MALDRKNTAALTELSMLNNSFDREANTLVVQALGFDGATFQRPLADALALKMVTSGSYIYICLATPGSAESDPVWQIKRIDTTSGLVIQFADSNASFDNIATDPTALTYG